MTTNQNFRHVHSNHEPSTKNTLSLMKCISLCASVSPLLSCGSGTTHSPMRLGVSVVGSETLYASKRVNRDVDFLEPPSCMVADCNSAYKVSPSGETVRPSKP